MSNTTKQTKNTTNTYTSSEYKIRASILFKQLRSDDSVKATEAAKRFQRLPHFSSTSPEEIIAQIDTLQRKHALTVVALEQNYSSWADLKQALDNLQPPTVNLYPSRCGGFLNEWHSSYEAAKDALAERGGYLLPYKTQFFICGRDYITALGLDPDDANWERMDYDWAKPSDRDAWQALFAKLLSFEQALFV